MSGAPDSFFQLRLGICFLPLRVADAVLDHPVGNHAVKNEIRYVQKAIHVHLHFIGQMHIAQFRAELPQLPLQPVRKKRGIMRLRG